MAHLDIDFDNTPDEIVPIAPGIYELQITTAPEIEPTNDGQSTKLVIPMQVVTECEDKGRAISDHISLKDIGPKSFSAVRINRLAKSAGVGTGSGGIDTPELAGKIVKVQITNETYKDKVSGEMRDAARVHRYLFGNED